MFLYVVSLSGVLQRLAGGEYGTWGGKMCRPRRTLCADHQWTEDIRTYLLVYRTRSASRFALLWATFGVDYA